MKTLIFHLLKSPVRLTHLLGGHKTDALPLPNPVKHRTLSNLPSKDQVRHPPSNTQTLRDIKKKPNKKTQHTYIFIRRVGVWFKSVSFHSEKPQNSHSYQNSKSPGVFTSQYIIVLCK